MTPVHTRVDIRVATIWAEKVCLGGIWQRIVRLACVDVSSRIGLFANLDIMSYLQIIGKRNSMGTSNVAEGLEIVHSQLVSKSAPLIRTWSIYGR